LMCDSSCLVLGRHCLGCLSLLNYLREFWLEIGTEELILHEEKNLH